MIHAEIVTGGVLVWKDGDDVRSLYTRDVPGYWRWYALAIEQRGS